MRTFVIVSAVLWRECEYGGGGSASASGSSGDGAVTWVDTAGSGELSRDRWGDRVGMGGACFSEGAGLASMVLFRECWGDSGGGGGSGGSSAMPLASNMGSSLLRNLDIRADIIGGASSCLSLFNVSMPSPGASAAVVSLASKEKARW